MKKIVIALATTFMSVFAGHASAVTVSTPMVISADVLSVCIVASTPLVFGSYDGTRTTDTTGSSTVTLTCVGTSSAAIQLSNGANFAGGTRNMANLLNSDKLAYGLFQPTSNQPNAACPSTLTVPFGGAGIGISLPVVGLSLLAQTFNVCGSIPKGQAARTGAYTDIVSVDINF